MSAFSLLNAPPRFPSGLRCIKNAPLPIRSIEIDRLPELRYTVYRQSLSARDRSMSQLLRSEEHTSELQSLTNLVCRLLLEKKKNKKKIHITNEVQQTTRFYNSLHTT